MTDRPMPSSTDADDAEAVEARASALDQAAHAASSDLDKNGQASEAIDRATAAVRRDEG